MFGKKKPERPKRNHSGKNLAQYGLFDVPPTLSYDSPTGGSIDDGNDSDLEAELMALANDPAGGKPRRPARPKVAAMPPAYLDAMVSESMKEIPSDEELSGDEDDPDLLNELDEITGGGHAQEEPPSSSSAKPSNDITRLLDERLKLYQTAEAGAKATGENGRARRFGRGINTLKDLIKQANAGKPVNEEDIPPEITVNARKPEPETVAKPEAPLPARPAPPPPPSKTPSEEEEPPSPAKPPLGERDKETLQLLSARQDEYKMAAVRAKKSGDTETALAHVKIAKQFDAVIKAVEEGQAVDLSQMPGPPPPLQPRLEENTMQTNAEVDVQEETPLITAGSVAEALQQRLDVYKKQEEAAKEQGNSGKARRMGRIVKQYEQAIKSNGAGKPIPVDDLPTPPGYAPIPVPGAPKPEENKVEAVKPEPAPSVMPEEPAKPKPAKPAPPPPPPPQSSVSRISGNHVPTTRAEKQVQQLLARQKEFKLAALAAKKKGELEQAKEFLKTAKGFEPLIEASQGGLPVDFDSLPVPPSARSQLENEFDIVMADECTEDDAGHLDVLARLETQLTKQLKMCLATRDHNKAIGDVAGTNRFEQLALSVTKDLDVIRMARRDANAGVPKFHYETRSFSVVKTFTELNDNDLEFSIVRGINYLCSNPKEIDTYVKFEFAYPQEQPVTDRTVTVKNTNNPEYNTNYILPIQRDARACLRYFKRHGIKLEVYSKGGLFRGDTLLGTVTVKLQHLETQCELHDSFDLMDGRKKVGGKLEVKLRVRNPLLTRQVEQITEKWLVLDH